MSHNPIVNVPMKSIETQQTRMEISLGLRRGTPYRRFSAWQTLCLFPHLVARQQDGQRVACVVPFGYENHWYTLRFVGKDSSFKVAPVT